MRPLYGEAEAALDAQRWDPISTRLALLILGLLPLALFGPGLFGGQLLWGSDIETLGLPLGLATRRALAQGEWPHWLPELLGGLPSIAGTNTDFLYPTVLLQHLLGVPLALASAVDAALHMALAGFGLFGLARSLGVSRTGALMGALAFSLSGSLLSILFAGHVNNMKAVALIPWAFWAVQSADRGWSRWALAGLVLALQNLALGMQISAYTVLGLAAFALWRVWSAGGRRADYGRALAGLALCGLFAFLIAAPQLLPSLEYKAYSWREGFSYEQFVSWSFNPKEALAWVVPGYFGWREPTYHGAWDFSLSTEYLGLLPWLLAAAALADLTPRPPLRSGEGEGAWPALRSRLRQPAGFFLLLALFAFLAGIGKHFPLHHLFYQLPLYNGFRAWTRFLVLLTLALCVLAGFGWDRLQSDEGGRARRGALGFGVLALLLALLALGTSRSAVLASASALAQKLGPSGPSQALQMAQASAYKAGVLALLLLAALVAWPSLRKLGRWLPLGLLALLAVDAGEVARRFVVFKPAEAVLAKPALLQQLPDPVGLEPYRLWDPQGVWTHNTAAAYGYESLQGYHGMQMAAPMRLQQALAQRQLDWLALSNTRYVLLPAAQGVPQGWRDLGTGPGGPRIYENPGAWPRARLLGAARDVTDDAQALELLRQGAPLEPALVRGAPSLPTGALQGSVRFERRSSNAMRLQVTASRPALLLLSQTWYPAWRARVGGQVVPLLSAYGGALSALAVPAGEQRVELWYQPTALRLGLALALLGLLALLALILFERRRRPSLEALNR